MQDFKLVSCVPCRFCVSPSRKRKWDIKLVDSHRIGTGHCQIAEHKAQVVASDFGLQSDLAIAIRRLGGDGRLVTASMVSTSR